MSRHLETNIPKRKKNIFTKLLEWNLEWRIVKTFRNFPVWKIINDMASVEKLKVCEVGCGNEGGVLAGASEKIFKKISYIGFNPELDFDKVKNLIRENVKFEKGYADEKSVEPESQDLVVCMEVLEHIPEGDRKNVIKNLLGFVKDGGLLIISYPVQGISGRNAKIVREYINERKKKFGQDDFVWDVQHFVDDNPNNNYCVPKNDYMKNMLGDLGNYELKTIKNLNIIWWKFFYKMQYGVYPILPYISRLIFRPLFPVLNIIVHKGETFREIYIIKK